MCSKWNQIGEKIKNGGDLVQVDFLCEYVESLG